MFIINACPKCHKDFMYHKFDEGFLTIKSEISGEDILICHECREQEDDNVKQLNNCD